MNTLKREGESELSYFLRNIGMATGACCIAEAITVPIDSAKTRLQLQEVVPG